MTLLPLLLLINTLVFAQNVPPPPPVRVSFERDFPGSNNVQWDLRNDQWHANYRDKNNRDVDTYYDVNGRRVERHFVWVRRNTPPEPERMINIKKPPERNDKVIRIKHPKPLPRFHIKLPPRPPHPPKLPFSH